MKNRILNTYVHENQLAMFFLGQEGFIFKTPEQKTILIDGFLTGELLHEGRESLLAEIHMKEDEIRHIDWLIYSLGKAE